MMVCWCLGGGKGAEENTLIGVYVKEKTSHTSRCLMLLKKGIIKLYFG